jgi:threonine-phosphate decarboxylase
MRLLSQPFPRPAALFRHGGAPAGRGPVLDFSASINPLGPPVAVLRALRRELLSIARYPDPVCTELTARLAALHGVGSDQIVVGNGSNELIHALARAVRPRRVAIAEPTYTEYMRASLLAGAEVDHWMAERDDFAGEHFDPAGADLVWLCNPNNPTGLLWPPRPALLPWIQAFPQTLFAVDEAFLPFLTYEDHHSLVPDLQRLPNLVVLRSLTKLYALPGLRLGYAVTNSALAARLRDQFPPWSVNALAQVAGLAALEDAAFLRRTRSWAEAENSFMNRRLTVLLHHLRPVRSQAIFMLVRLHDVSSAQLAAALRERGILLRDASNFIGLDRHYIRISLRSAEDNRCLVRELSRYLAPGDDLGLAEDDPSA